MPEGGGSTARHGRLPLPMRLDELDYLLPREQIAQRPLECREASRLLLQDRSSGNFEDRLFAELPSLLRGDELLVVNNARVIPARLFGRRAGVPSEPPPRTRRREHLAGKVEILLTREVDSATWEALVRPGRKIQVGQRILFGEGELEAEVLSRGQLGLRTLHFMARDENNINKHFERLGHVPLPPYIERADEASDRERYQTVFAKRPGAIAAPTAGLHFSAEILHRIRARGAEICELTLHVGLGKAVARLFIVPGFRFRVVEGLLTNFHLPRSTLLALVCAFAGRERVLAAYQHAVNAGYRFYSYGDCSLVRSWEGRCGDSTNPRARNSSPDLPLQNLRRSEKQAERPHRTAASRPAEEGQRLSLFTR